MDSMAVLVAIFLIFSTISISFAQNTITAYGSTPSGYIEVGSNFTIDCGFISRTGIEYFGIGTRKGRNNAPGVFCHYLTGGGEMATYGPFEKALSALYAAGREIDCKSKSVYEGSRKFSVRIKNVTLEYPQDYVCLGGNSVNNPISYSNNTIRIQIGITPNVTITGNKAAPGTKVIHSVCTTGPSRPPADIEWRLDGIVLNGSYSNTINITTVVRGGLHMKDLTKGTTTTRSEIRLKVTNAMHGKRLRCGLAGHPSSTSSSTLRTDEVTLDASYGPIFDRSKEVITIPLATSTRRIQCISQSYPPVSSYYWRQDSSPSALAGNVRSPTVSVHFAQIKPGATVIVICTPSNGINTGQKTFLLRYGTDAELKHIEDQNSASKQTGGAGSSHHSTCWLTWSIGLGLSLSMLRWR